MLRTTRVLLEVFTQSSIGSTCTTHIQNLTSTATVYIHSICLETYLFLSLCFNSALHKTKTKRAPADHKVICTPTIGTGFTAVQTEQLQDAFIDAMTLASCAVIEIPGPIFTKYFRREDEGIVRAVFEQIRGHPSPDKGPDKMGNPLLRDITIFPNYPDNFTADPETAASMWDYLTDRPDLTVTPLGFKFGGLFQAYPGGREINCETVGSLVSPWMETLGAILLHEYT